MRPIHVDLNKHGTSVLLFEDGIQVAVPYSTALAEARRMVAPSGAAHPTEPAGEGVAVAPSDRPLASNHLPGWCDVGEPTYTGWWLDGERVWPLYDSEGGYLEREP